MTCDFSSLQYVPEKLRQFELYPKLTDMMDYIICNFQTEFEDVKYKYSGPDVVREVVITEIISELGFKYVSDIFGTVSNIEFNIMLDFLGLVNLLKGSRLGLELVLKLLRFETVIQEWWQQFPKGDPHTYVITVIMDASFVPDPLAALQKIQAFTREYVYSVIGNIDFRFSLKFAEKNVNVAGFVKAKYNTADNGFILGTVYPLI